MHIIPIIITGVFIAACSADFFKAADDIATDTAVKIEISKEAIPTGSQVSTSVQITPPIPPVILPKSNSVVPSL